MGGGAERETFYEAQRRHRRSAWRFSVLSVASVLMLGLPLSVIVSPFVTAVGLIAVDLADRVHPMPNPTGRVGRSIERWSESNDPGGTGDADRQSPAGVDAQDVATGALALVAPGMVLMTGAWLCVRRVFLRSGAGAVVLAAGARPPHPDDVEERQLVNLVEEMALAAGVPAPGVVILDGDVVNAAVVGRSIHDATLIIPRRVLDDLGRAPTGALVADLLAVVVNGDLRVALVIASMFQTLDLAAAVLGAPLDRRTRRVLWRLARLAVRPTGTAGSGDGSDEIRFVARELAAVGDFGAGEDGAEAGCVTSAVQFPFLVASLAFAMTRLLVGGFVTVPLLGALWRRRRLLADATAVELTRDPDALAVALEYLQDQGGPVAAAGPWTHLFVVGPEVGREKAHRELERRRDEVWTDERRPDESRSAAFWRRSRAAVQASNEYQQAVSSDSSRDDQGMMDDLSGFLPPLGKRIERVQALGAQRRPDSREPVTPPKWPLPVRFLGAVVGLVLVAVLAVLMLLLFACLVGLIYLAILFEALLLTPLVALVHAVAR